MVYLDYSATTPVSNEVLDTFLNVAKKYCGNPNSNHKIGIAANKLINEATNQIAEILKIKATEIIYTSGATEGNNHAIKAVCETYANRGKTIITTKFEHPSVYGPLNYLSKKGFKIEFLKITKDGLIDLSHLEKLLTKDVILVTIGAVNSEVGIKQPIAKIAQILKKHDCFFHCDMTQSVGKEKVVFKDIDFATLSAHKFRGIKGIGILYKKENIIIPPLIHGGHSTTSFRGGTPPTELIASMAKALRLAYEDIDQKNQHIEKINLYLKNELAKINKVFINSNNQCLPHILNISVVGIKSETILNALSEKEIYISTQTACSSKSAKSETIYLLTNDEKRAKSSLRISISYTTTKIEIDFFVESLATIIKELDLRSKK